MDPQPASTITILEKTRLPHSEEMKPATNNIITLATWSNEEQDWQDAPRASYVIGANELSPEIEALAKQMAVGDRWKIRAVDRVSEKEKVLYIARLPNDQDEDAQVVKLDTANVRAEASKKEGNNFIKEKKYQEAIQSYKKAYNLVEYSCDREGVQIRLSVISNLALATLNTLRYRECLQWCTKYCSQSPEPNKKVLYRQVSAFKGLKQWQSAKEHIGRALLFFKNDQEALTDFTSLREALEKEQKEEIVKQKKMYTNMFG